MSKGDETVEEEEAAEEEWGRGEAGRSIGRFPEKSGLCCETEEAAVGEFGGKKKEAIAEVDDVWAAEAGSLLSLDEEGLVVVINGDA